MTSKRFLQFASLLFLIVVTINRCTTPKREKEDCLKDALNGKFHIGVALNIDQIAGKDSLAIDIVEKQFNSIVPENCMKMENIQPEKGVFNFKDADAYVAFGEKNNMKIIGHTLVWHSQAAKWAFTDDEGNDVSREELIERMRNHIHTVVGHFKGRVHGWDVVNEAILDNGEWRPSKWYEIIGPEFIQLAFEFAHEADPEAELYYNDYSVSHPAKRDSIFSMLKSLISKGVKIDGVGLQGHCTMDFPPVNLLEEAIIKLSGLGIKTMITEMDITVIPWPSEEISADVSLSFEQSAGLNPYPESMPDSAYNALMDRYVSFFEMFLKQSDKIDRVTLWGVHDEQSWRNNWPFKGRKDYPLLFDREYQPKSAVKRIIELAK